jgi:hypothetical protein
MMPAMRLLLAGSALLMIHFMPPLASPNLPPIKAVLACYTVSSSIIYGLSWGRSFLTHPIKFWASWADVAVYLLLIGLAAAGEHLLPGLFYLYLSASFREAMLQEWV